MRSRNSWIRTSATYWPALAVLATVFVSACSKSGEPPIAKLESLQEGQAVPELTHPVTLSGVSAGGYMAVQTHIALAARVKGIGIVAAGPYHCAAGSVANALRRCMSGDDLDIAPLLSFAREAAASGSIAGVDALRESRVWMLHSPEDQVVGRNVAVGLADFYREFVSADQLRFVDDIQAAHGWPTLDFGNDCLEQGGAFINSCDYDTAGNLLNYLYDDLEPRVDGTRGDELSRIDLSGYVESGSGMADAGYIFVPQQCRRSVADCRLHIAFHGCLQGAEFIDDQFAANAGLNEWAAQNRLVIVYPQIESSFMNPKGCWDWWGYTGPQYDQKGGKQVSGIDAIITAFAKQELYELDAE